MQERQRTEEVLFSPSTLTVVDILMSDGRTMFARKTPEELRRSYPDAEQVHIETAVARIEGSCITQPERITEEQFTDAFGVLPPINWVNFGETESFKMGEAFSGYIHHIYCRIGIEHWTFLDRVTLKHEEIVAKVRSVLT